MSDHGQTRGGDHGGGAPDETDTVLIAVSPAKLRARLAARRRRQQTQQPQDENGKELPWAPLLNDAELDRRQTALQSAGWAAAWPTVAATVTAPVPLSDLICGDAIAQIDLTPALALLLGAPIPFGNLGRAPRSLWRVLAERLPFASGAGPAAPPQQRQQGNAPAAAAAAAEAAAEERAQRLYAAALEANAAQVARYLEAYSRVARLPARALARCRRLFAAAGATAAGGRAGGGGGGVSGAQAEGAAWAVFLEAAAALARAQFTQFHGGFIWGGAAAMGAVVALHLWLCW